METKPCTCGKKMIKRYSDIVLTSNPPQQDWYWWCNCGHKEYGGRETGLTPEQGLRAYWEAAQK